MICLLQGSPHKTGVSETLCHILERELQKIDHTRLVSLASARVLPCCGCRMCEKPPHTCVLSRDDSALKILEWLREADLVLFTSPIYFYALPAVTKALIDRAQCFWEENNTKALKTEPRPAIVLLHAARLNGDKLFEGAFLTLRYFFQALNRQIVDFRFARGLEQRADIDTTLISSLKEWTSLFSRYLSREASEKAGSLSKMRQSSDADLQGQDGGDVKGNATHKENGEREGMSE